MAALSALLFLWTRWSSLPGIGKSLQPLVERGIALLPGTDTVRKVIRARPDVVGGLALLLVPLLWYALAHLAWNWWEARDVGRLFSRQPYDYGGLPFSLFVLLGFVLIVLPWAGSLAWEQLVLIVVYSLIFTPLAAIVLIGISRHIRKEAISDGTIEGVYWGATLLSLPCYILLFLKFGTETIPLNACGWPLLIMLLVLLYDRYLSSSLSLGSRLAKWLTLRSLKSPPKGSAPGSYANRLSTYVQDFGGFVTGLGVLVLSLQPRRLELWGLILLLAFYAALFSLATLAKDNPSRMLRRLSWLGIIFAILSVGVLLYVPAVT
jgi:hypothetical protein